MDSTGEGDRKTKALFDMVITGGSPSQALKIPLSWVGEKSKAAKHRVKKESSGERNVPYLDLRNDGITCTLHNKRR